MKTTPGKFPIQTEVNNSTRYFVLFGAFFFGWVTYMMRDALYQRPPELLHLAIFLIGPGFTIWALAGFWIYFDHIKVFSDRLEITNFRGHYNRTIYFSEIAEIRKIHKSGKYEAWDELVILLKNRKKHKIYSTSYRNYNEIETALSRNAGLPIGNGKSRNDTIKSIKISIAVLSLLFVVFATALVYLYGRMSNGVDRQDLERVELTLDDKPVIHTGRKRKKNLEIHIREYPEFDFDIAGQAYTATDAQNFVNHTQAGSRITMTLDKDEYRQKLARVEDITFWKKYFNYRDITVYEIKDQNQVYLSLRHYEHARQNDYQWGILGAFGFLIFLIYAGYTAWVELKENQGKVANQS